MLELMLLIALYYFIRSLQAALKDMSEPEEKDLLPPSYDDENVVDINAARRKRANGR